MNHPAEERKDPMRFLAGDGEMAARIRAFDWASTPLGPPATWSAGLRTMVRMLLTTRHPVYIFWGAEHTGLYNDAYRESLGPEKHPAILGIPGRRAWAEIWHLIGPQILQVLAGGGATWHQNQLVPIIRHGCLDDVYWTYSFGPIDDESAANGVGGVLVLVTETTRQVMAERQAKLNHARLASLFEQAPNFMAMLSGKDHRFELVNPAYERLIGRRDVMGLPFSQAIPEAVDQGYVDLLDQVFATGEPYIAAYAKFRSQPATDVPPDERIVDFVFQPTFDNRGEVDGIFVVGIDVTAQWQAQQELAVKIEQLQLATDAGEVGLWDVDNLANTLYWAPRVKKMFGVREQMPVTIADYYDGIHPEDRDATIAAYQRAQSPLERALYDVEFRTIGKEDGRVRWVAACGRGIFDSQGHCTRVIGTAIDVTARKRNEALLRHLNETLERKLSDYLAERKLLADIVEGTDALIQVMDLNYRWLAINRASAAGFERAFGIRPRVGDQLQYLLHEHIEVLKEIEPGWTRALAGQEFLEVRSFGPSPSEQRSFEMRFQPLYDSDGRLIGAYQFAYDVTERIEHQRRLAESEAALYQARKLEAIGQLTGAIAHDFNNLLQVVSANLEMIRRRAENPAQVRDFAKRGTEAASRGARLTAQLLAFSRKQELVIRPVGLGALVDGMADLLKTTLGASVELQLAAEDVWVHADATQLEMALLNLAVNAKDAMPDGGRFTLASRVPASLPRDLAPGEYVEISATDTGTGMPPEVMAKAFDPFFTTKAVGKGSGLGLSQVYGLATRAGGTVVIDSDGVTGTTIKVYLKRALGENSGASQDAPASGPVALAPWSVLLVDDEEEVRRGIAAMLTDLGLGVHQAENAEQGLQLLDAHQVELLLVDYAMPGSDGAAMARVARQAKPELPIMFVSGHADAEVIREAIGYGATLLRKPVSSDQLELALRRLQSR
ncbi:PAS domain-containing protein [Ideonella azotifigens]|uniref:PAS domain-containing protein n=1 Tax=Ideonella azotifigens TaxID=513160 RepID=UPI001E592029|nr:PAS domain-containing protein [Ideonella azotifigens]MCD2341966.1 PAS domain-containing protein [Ideonella azotifigens]